MTWILDLARRVHAAAADAALLNTTAQGKLKKLVDGVR